MKNFFLILTFFIVNNLLSQEPSFLKGDLVTVNDGKYQIKQGILLKTLKEKITYFYKPSPELIKINLTSEAFSTNSFSRDKFIFLSTIIIYTNMVYFLDSVFYGYVDNNIFMTETDFKFLDKPFDYPDIEINLHMDKDKYSVNIKSSFLRISRYFEENWNDFYHKEEKFKRIKQFIEERKKILSKEALNASNLTIYNNDDYSFTIKYPVNWEKENLFIDWNWWNKNDSDADPSNYKPIVKFENFDFSNLSDAESFDTIYHCSILIEANKISDEGIVDRIKDYYNPKKLENINFSAMKWTKITFNEEENDGYLTRSYTYVLLTKKNTFVVNFSFSGDFDENNLGEFMKKIMETFKLIP